MVRLVLGGLRLILHSIGRGMKGLDRTTMAMFFADFISGHAHDVMGEISVTKGLLGKKGYPF